MKYPTIKTDRLELRELTLDDTSQVQAHFADENVTRFMDIEPCKSEEEAKEMIQYHLDDAGCRWGIFIDDILIGTCGYHNWMQTENVSKAEIGFDLSKQYWGKGYMSEVMKPLLQFGFQEMGLNVIDATVETENEKSILLLMRNGFKKHEELQDGLFYFTLTNEQCLSK